MVTVEYRITAANRAEVLAGLELLGHERRRDGAYSWSLFQDTAHSERILETFLTDSWVEHLRQHQRVTQADRVIEERVRHLLTQPPRITHYIATSAVSGSPPPADGPGSVPAAE